MNATPMKWAPYTPPRYIWQWIVTLIATAAGVAWYFKIQNPTAPTSAASESAVSTQQDSLWFFVLQLPNPKLSDGRGEVHRKISDWFSSLQRSGYHPMLLSDVGARLTRGQLLPDKAIVLSFDEALLDAFNTYSPILETFKFPAVMVTSARPLAEGDRGYLSSYEIRKLAISGRWDVVLIDKASPPRLLTTNDIPLALPLPPGVKPWSVAPHRPLANQLADVHRPSRLFVDWKWSGQDLITRLQAETPVHPDGSPLAARFVGDRQWGIVLPKSDPSDKRFSLRAVDDKRGGEIAWTGTRSLKHFEARFSMESLTGQIWFLIRPQNNQGDGIRVGFSGDNVMVREVVQGKQRLLGLANGVTHPLNGTIRLQGRHLQVTAQGQVLISVRVPAPSDSTLPGLQMLVYDEMFGGAEARNVSLSVMPLISYEDDSL